MQILMAIAAGGAIGAVLRHFVNSGAMHLLGGDYPWGIFIINILGSFAMGCLAAFSAHIYEPPQLLKAFLAVGVLGGFTTFSAFSLDAALLWERGDPMAAFLYAMGSVVLAIGGLFAGMALIRAVAA